MKPSQLPLSQSAYPPIPERIKERIKKINNYILIYTSLDTKSKFVHIDDKNRLLIDGRILALSSI
jgi:hypothetical protein